MKRRKRKALAGIGITLLLLALVLVFLPVWLPWLLAPLASRFGVVYGHYERLGYGRFVLREVAYTNLQVRLEADRIRTDIPTAVLWNRLRGHGSVVNVQNWSLFLVAENDPSKASRTNTPADILAQLQTTLAQLNAWVARAALTNGVVTFQQHAAAVPWLVWQGPAIDTRVVLTVPQMDAMPVELALRSSETGVVTANAMAPGIDFRSALVATRTEGALTVHTTNFWNTNRFLASARFTRDLIPESAHISAPAVHVINTNLPAFGYRAVDGSLTGAWTNKTLDVRLAFNGQSDNTNFPAVSGTILARADTNSATIRQLHLESPALHAELSAPARFSYRGELLSGPARLDLTGDLAQLPIVNLQGAARGTLDIRPRANTYPEADLELALTNVVARGLHLASATVTSQLRWPWLRIVDLRAALGAGAEIQAAATAHLTDRFLSNATVRITGHLPTNILPASLQYSNLLLVAEASGALTSLVHQAHLTVRGAQVPSLVPLDLQIRERGQQFKIATFSALLTGNETALDFSGAGEWNATSTSVSLGALNLSRGAIARRHDEFAKGIKGESSVDYSLAEPVTLRIINFTNTPPRLQMTPLHWRGDGRTLAIEANISWPAAGSGRVSGAGWRLSDFTNLLESPVSAEALVKNIDLAAQWTNGPVLISLNATTEINTTSAPPVVLTASATNDATALHITHLEAAMVESAKVTNETVREPTDLKSLAGRGPPRLAGSTTLLLIGEAVLPISATANTNGFAVQVHSNAPVRIDLHTSTNDALSRMLAEFAKVRVAAPALHVALGGTFQQPQGTIQISADSLAPLSMTNDALPELKNARAEIVFDLEAVQLRELRANIAGQPITGSGEVPIAAHGEWRSRLQLDKARADLRMPSADLAAFAPFATNLLAPRGTMEVNATLRPGMQIGGYIRVTDAATAPFPTIGPISGIDAEVQLRDRAVRIEAVKAQVGGAPLVVHGGIDFSDWKAETKRWPSVRLRVAGTNIALVRESQKIIRTDLDLQITNAAGGTPSIGGVVNLRDSLFLAELANLVPSGVRKPSQRPPYFSVDAPLVRDWSLDVRVQGDRFLTMRTPFFKGEVSVNLDVRGNLAAPLAVGDVRLNTGTINFPFATLAVKQGFVTLGSANPYDPQLFVTAAGRAYDFDILLEMTGSAQSPILAFTSVPPLTSEQILLLVTSGQVPRTDYSLSTQQRAQGVGIFVGKSFMSQLGFGGSGENLTIRSGESISERGRSTYSVEYKLTEDVSLVGEYDRFDEYNAGVKWRIFSK